MRPVIPFVDLDLARADARTREACIVMDVHGLLWSVPTELHVHDVNTQILGHLHDGALQPFPKPVFRPHLVVR